MLAAAAPAARAQSPRPWLDWKTVETEHFVFHYPEDYREWTIRLAERMEGIRAQVAPLVGSVPVRRVHVVVDDPSNDANGTAFPALDAPTIVLWPTPPDPRSEIGSYRVWQELLATHEYAHIAHLTRASRNRMQRLLFSLSPVPLGPITMKAPRWVLEGYATYVEGRVTGSGRPPSVARAALIRQFALEGRLPSYPQLSATGDWKTGSFAYLVGSAYLEWLARRQGDSSVTALWRRLTAVTNRSFDAAFAGVYGGSPAELYGRFTTELSGSALELERALKREGLVEGRLVQRLTRTTGDPAISPDGRFVAITIRKQDAPSELVVWRTSEEPDTAGARLRELQRRRDPEDVPDRVVFPAPKKPVISLTASDGAPYETPRWFADNRHLLVSRLTPAANGTVRPDLYIWNAEDGDLRRLTTGASLRDADPAPDGSWAAAVRCDRGWCDLVRVDVATGGVTVLRAGSVERNYYRPRVSPRTGEIVVGEQFGDRWRVARVSPATGALRYADPDDGVTRYDASFTTDGRNIVATSEATGIANLERIDTLRAVTRLTSVTGAAVAADVAPDGAVWFLNFHGSGYDLRRLAADSGRVAVGVPVTLALADSLAPILPPRVLRLPFDSTSRPVRAPARLMEAEYGIGPSRVRWLPANTSGFGGNSLQITVLRTDPVGRLGMSLMGAVGSAALPSGVALTLASHLVRPNVIAQGWSSHEAPSRAMPQAGDYGLDVSRFGAALRIDDSRTGDGGDLGGSLGLLAERQHAAGFDDGTTRRAAVGTGTIVRRQRDQDARYLESFTVLGEAGGTGDGGYLRQRAAFFFGTAEKANRMSTVRLQYGTVGGESSARETFVLGGIPSPLLDPVLDARRVEAPAYPVGSVAGVTFAAYRVTFPIEYGDVFYSGASTDLFQTSLRSFGIEIRNRVAAIPALGTPAVDVASGIARALDAPVAGKWSYYVTVAIRP